MRIFAKIVICLGLVLLTLTCSTTKKIQAANILKKCKFTYHSAQVDGFVKDSLKFTVFLDASNSGEDSLFVENLSGTFHLDSLFEIPFSLQTSKWISPGSNRMEFAGALEMNLFKLLALPNVQKFRMQGKAWIALKPGQKSIDVNFDESHDVPPDLVEKQLRKILGM